MKNKIVGLVLLLLTLGCNRFPEDINVNPNEPTQASASQLIAYAERSLPTLATDPQGEFYAQYLAETQYPNLSLYNQIAFSFYGWYSGPLVNLEQVIRNPSLARVADGPVANQVAVAKILKALYFWNMTDRWGDIPYTEALQGKENFTPRYDPQQSIYTSLFALLKQAQGEIVAGSISNDLVYGGNMDRWKRLAGTLRLLMALRLSKVDPATGATEFKAALADGVMAGNADNLTYKHLADIYNQNYWYGQVVNLNRRWWAPTETLVNYLKATADPRLKVYADPNTKGDYVGLAYGTTTALDQKDPSLLGASLYKQDAPVPLVTYAQVLFARAEATKRGWVEGGDAAAKTLYENALTASLQQWTGSSTGLAALLASPQVGYQPERALEQIATQRYVHLYMNGYEAWAEWRRTGYPTGLVQPDGKAIPRRMAYPEQEKSNNAAHYNEAVQRQFGGQDGAYGRVWWDKP